MRSRRPGASEFSKTPPIAPPNAPACATRSCTCAPQARDFLVERLSTPLPFAEYLNRAFTDAFHLGAETVTSEIVENTLSAGFDSLDAKLVRIGYTPKSLAERFDAYPTEIRRFLNGRLDPERTAELGADSRNAGIPT